VSEGDRIDRAGEMRQAFDHAFALRASVAAADVEDLLAIRVAGEAYAVRVRDIIEIATKCKVVPVPAAAHDLLGLAGIRGAIVPVFGLASILGHAQEPVRWIISCSSHDPIALGFSELEGHLRVARSSIYANTTPPRPYLTELARDDGEVRAMIAIPQLVATLRTRSKET
jgi:chemotaxis signal transduction protein